MRNSSNHNSQHHAGASGGKGAYVMVPATAVIDDDDGKVDAHNGTSTKHGDTSSFSTAQVLEVVTGEALPPSSPARTTMPHEDEGDDSTTYIKGVVLEPSYNDVAFAGAFLVNVLVTAASALFWGIPNVNSYFDASGSNNNGTSQQDNNDSAGAPDENDHLLLWFLVLLLLGSMWSYVAIRALLRGALTCPTEFVRVAYLSAPVLIIASCAVLFALRDGLSNFYASLGLFCGVLLLFSWRPLRTYIPFASATLKVSAIAVQENSWAVAVSLGSVLVLMAWLVVWMLAFLGFIDRLDKASGGGDNNNGNEDDDLDSSTASFLTFMAYVFFFSLYWGQQVVRNVVHFTTSGAVSTWWFMPSHEHDGKRAVKDSLRRATTYSFGSICMASLLNTIAETTEAALRSNDHQTLLTCILVCLLSCVRAWLEYFNNFALVYSALYNSDYWTAGKQVVHLFKHAGWTTFINDALVFRVFLMCQFAAASLTGLCSVALFAAFGPGGDGRPASTNRDEGLSYGSFLYLMYCLGFVMGIMASSPVLFVLESTARTVMVCLAEQPYQFQEAHPELFELLTRGWSEAYPEAWQQQKVIAVAEPMREPLL